MLHFLLIAVAAPETLENLDALDQRVAAIAAHAQPVDKRLKLAACPQNPIITPPEGGIVVIRCPAIGWRIRVTLSAQAAESGQREALVRKGQMVEAISEGAGFSASTYMVALEDGAVGDAIRVKSPTSQTPMTAKVSARGVVNF